MNNLKRSQVTWLREGPDYALASSRMFLREADVDLVRWVTRSLADRANLRVVDLGAGSGTTSAAVFEARWDDVLVTTFEINPVALQSTEQFHTNTGHRPKWEGYVMDSVEAANLYAEDSVDLLLIDTSHEYAHTVRELVAWLPKLKRSGWLWMHDYVGDYPGVTQAIDESVARGEITPRYQNGLGWAGKRA